MRNFRRPLASGLSDVFCGGSESWAGSSPALSARQAFAAEHLGNLHRLTDTEIIEVVRYGRRGRPAKGAEPEEVRYCIKAELKRNEAAIEEDLKRSGRYILATNVRKLKGDELLTEYKGRQSVERGFRFLKEPQFFASSVFVKSPRRVAAIAMVMGLCLLVYALGERSLRRALEELGASIRHQTGKPTQKPTLRWVFQLFQAVHLLSGDGAEQVSNLTEERRSILGFLGQRCQSYYLLR